MPLPIEDIDWVEVSYSNREDYGGNIASVYLEDYGCEEVKKCYISKTVNKPWLDQLLPDDAYLHWDNTIDIMVNDRVDVIMEDRAEDIADKNQGLADNAQSLVDTLVEPDHGLLQSTTTSPPPSDRNLLWT